MVTGLGFMLAVLVAIGGMLWHQFPLLGMLFGSIGAFGNGLLMGALERMAQEGRE